MKTQINLKPHILIVIPTFNNIRTIESVTLDAVKTGYDLLIVNDGSDDGTEKSIDKLSNFTIHLKNNSGKGAAIIKAAKWAKKNNYSHIITIDADGQHNPSEIINFIPKIQSNPMTIVVGTRNFNQETIPGSSRFGRKFSNFWLKAACGVSIPDSQSGFRAYPVDAILKLKCKDTRYNFEIEILAKAAWAGLDILSTDISVHYSDKTKESSHFHPLKDNFRISLTYTKLVTRNFIPIPHKILFGQSHKEKMKDFFFKPIKTFKELIKERTSAKELGLASALGILLAVLPLVTIHSVAILFCATRLKLNRIMAISVSHFCMPPIVPAICVEVGYYALHGKFLTDFNLNTLGYHFLDRVGDYLLGTIIVAPILAILIGCFVYFIAKFIYWIKKIPLIK